MADTYYVDTSKDNIFTISVNEDGKTSWNKVNALTKHLPMNADGTNDLVKITTKSGRKVTATKAKSFLVIKEKRLIATRGDKIREGEYIPIIKNYPEKEDIDLGVVINNNDKYRKLKISLNDVYYDKIVSIEYVKPSHKYVYDLTVENDKTFLLYDGILMEDE